MEPFQKSTYQFIVDEKSKIIKSYNANVLNNLGYNQSELKTTSYEKIIDEKSGFISKNDSSRIQVVFTKSKFDDFIFFSAFDVSAIKKYQDDLQRAREDAETANSLKSEFYANMTHEIRTPLNAIIGFSDVLKEKIPKEYHHYLKNIVKSGNNLLTIINDMLDIAIIDSGKLKLTENPVNLPHLLFSIVEEYKPELQKKKLDFQMIDQSAKSIYPLLDATRFKQVAENLIDNAIKYTEKGSITIEINYKNTSDDQTDFQVSIKDTGVGISENDKPNIFRSFIKTKKPAKLSIGKNLGLALSQRIINKMNGKINFKSELNKGSEFSISIKKVKYLKNLPVSSLENPNEKSDLSNMKILVAEDLPVNRLLIKEMLDEFSPFIIEADNGNTAVKAALENDLDLIFMDISMPYLDGISAAKKIKEHKKIPIVCFTASKSLDSESEKHFDGIITKPVSRNNLIKYLNDFAQKSKLETISDTETKKVLILDNYNLKYNYEKFIEEIEILSTTMNIRKIVSFVNSLADKITPIDQNFQNFQTNFLDALKKLNFTIIIEYLEELRNIKEPE